MDTGATQQLTRGQFLGGFFAALRLIHGKKIRAKKSEFHNAFHKAFSTSEIPAFKKTMELTHYCFDPLYGASGWLDLGIAEAKRDLLIEQPISLGHWEDTIICFNRNKAEQWLGKLGLNKEFLEIANDFVAALGISANYTHFFTLFMAGVFVSGGKYWATPRNALLPAFRHAIAATYIPVPFGYTVEDVSNNFLYNWLDNGLAYLCQIELIESNSNVLICDYRVKMTPETAENALRDSNMRKEFINLGRTFLNYLAAIPTQFGSHWGAQSGWTVDNDPR